MADQRIELNGGTDYLVYREGSGHTVEVLDIHVGSERRKKTGTLLIQHLSSKYPIGTMVWAITRTGNAIAQHFYESLGWKVVGVLRSFYCTDLNRTTLVDAIMYGRRIGDQS